MSDVFNTLNALDAGKSVKEKNGLKYVAWSTAWTEVKKLYPDATYRIIPQVLDAGGNERFWHEDGKTGWVEVEVTIDGITHREVLPIMNYKNQPIPAGEITSVDANKSYKRCLVKALAMHGAFTYIFQGEDVPEDTAKQTELMEKINEVVKKKCALSDSAKQKVGELCKNAEKEAFPELEDEFITGKYKDITDTDILEKLLRQLMTIRK